jgi:hypothetical protein
MDVRPETLSELAKAVPTRDIDLRVRRLGREALLSARTSPPVTRLESLLHAVVIGSFAVYAIGRMARIMLG